VPNQVTNDPAGLPAPPDSPPSEPADWIAAVRRPMPAPRAWALAQP
jgi:hypothetical protein